MYSSTIGLNLIDSPVVSFVKIKGLCNNILIRILAALIDAGVGCRISRGHVIKTGSEVHIMFLSRRSWYPAKNHALYHIQLLAIGRTWLGRFRSCNSGNFTNLLLGQNPVIDADIINQTVEKEFWGAIAPLVMCADGSVICSSTTL